MEKTLWATADKLCANISGYKMGYYNTERPHAFNGGIALALEGEKLKPVPGMS